MFQSAFSFGMFVANAKYLSLRFSITSVKVALSSSVYVDTAGLSCLSYSAIALLMPEVSLQGTRKYCLFFFSAFITSDEKNSLSMRSSDMSMPFSLEEISRLTTSLELVLNACLQATCALPPSTL